jgi:hypothetical protein
VKPALAKILRPYPKNKLKQKQRGGGGDQVAECLHGKCKALSSIRSTAKRKSSVGVGVGGHAYNPSIWVTEAMGLGVRGQPGLRSETLFWKNKRAGPPSNWFWWCLFPCLLFRLRKMVQCHEQK